ncbi:MAG: ABC transporter substrate-binding protein, partial [Bradyrhizobium sp.]
MKRNGRWMFSIALAAALTAGHASATRAADKVLTITSQSTITMVNPYGESETQMYGIWCQVYGCLGRVNFITKQYEGVLAEKWEVINPTTWRFTLRRDLKRQDGGPGPTARDVVHSWKRTMTDPDSAQRHNLFEVKEMVAVDDHTVDIVTLKPTGQLLSELFSLFIVTSAELYEKYGKDADKTHPFGWGPYKLTDFAVDQRIVLRKADTWPLKAPEAPDVV